MAEVLWREKMRRRAEIRAVFLGTYQTPGLWAMIGTGAGKPEKQNEEEWV